MKTQTPIVVGQPVLEAEAVGPTYVSLSAGVFASYFVRSDGKVDRFKGGRIDLRLAPPDGAAYVAASTGTHATYLLRDDGAVDRLLNGQVSQTLTPADFPKIKYTDVSNSAGPCYLLRSDGQVDLARQGEVSSTMATGPYQQIAGGTDTSYLLKEDGTVDKVYAWGSVCHTFVPPSGTRYVRIAQQGVSAKNDKGGGGATSIYFLRSDHKIDRASIMRSIVGVSMEPPEGAQYLEISCQDTSSYLLRSDGAVDRTTGGGKISNTMNPPPGQRYVSVAAGQMASYLLRSDGKVDRTKGWGTVSQTISPEVEPDGSGGCCLM